MCCVSGNFTRKCCFRNPKFKKCPQSSLEGVVTFDSWYLPPYSTSKFAGLDPLMFYIFFYCFTATPKPAKSTAPKKKKKKVPAKKKKKKKKSTRKEYAKSSEVADLVSKFLLST